MKKRVIIIAVNILLILALLPIQIFADSTAVIPPFVDEEEDVVIKPYYPDFDNSLGYNNPTTEDGNAILNAMMGQINSGNDPTGFSDDTLTPYGTQKGNAFTVLEKSELFMYTSLSGEKKSALLFDNLVNQNGQVKDSSYPMGHGITDNGISGLSFAQSVAFDPTGCGRRNYVAIIGYKNDENSTETGTVHLYLINSDTKTTEKHIELWARNSKLRTVMNSLTFVDSSNLFSVTAGDYNNDGKDSLVVYSGCTSSGTNSVGLREVSYTEGNWKVSNIYEGNNGVYMNSDYIKSGITNSFQLRNQLCVSLATGDLNGDGIDDLVVLSGAADIAQNYYSQSSIQNKPCIVQLCVGYGRSDSSKNFTVANLEIDRCNVSQTLNGSNTTIACGDVAVGDIDGDGRNEIIVAGYKNLTKTNDPYVISDGPLTYAYYKTDGKGTLKRTGNIRELAKSNVSPIAKDDSLRENEILFQKLTVECAAINGKYSKEYVFLSGWFYYLNSNGDLESVASNTEEYSTATSVTNPFASLTTKLYSKDIDEVFIASVTVGNLFATNNGNEAVAVVIGRKTHTNANAEGEYNFTTCIFWNNGNVSGKDIKLSYSEFRMSPMTYIGNGSAPEKSFVKGDTCSALLVSVDFSDDSIVGRYSGKAYSYTDPTTVAFLQAAPYYSEFDPGNSSTQYSYSESYRVTEGNSTEISYNVGLSVEEEAGALKTSMDIGIAYELTEEFTESLEKTFTTTFEANGENQVIVRQTLMYYYFYDVQVNNNGVYEFVPGALVISAPQYPVLTSLSMTQYNALAKAYNAKVDEEAKNGKPVDTTHKMELITEAQMEKYFLNNEGNPFAYASDGSAYTYTSGSAKVNGWDLSKAEVGSSDTWMKLSHAGGTQTQAYSVTLEKEKTQTVAEGGFVNMTIMLGGGVGSFSAYAGVTAEYERLDGSSYSTASITSTETSGTVQNLDSDAVSYGFDWKLIGWKTDDLFVGVPFVGYAVKSQKAPPQPVCDLKATFSSKDGGKVTLTWTAPEEEYGRSDIGWFYINCDQKTSFVSAITNKGAGKVHSVTLSVKDYSPRYATFTVTSYNELTEEASMPSNEAYCLFAMSDSEVNALVESVKGELEDSIKKLESAISADNTAIADLKQAVSDLDKAYKTADTLIKSDLANLVKDMTAFKSEVEQAQEALQKSIELVQSNLDKAIEDLQNEISQGDKANAEKIAKAIEEITAGYKKADELMKSEIDSDVSDLKKSLNDAQKALKEAIDKVQSNLDKAIEDLQNEISQGDKANAEKIAKAIEEITAGYKNADALIKSEIGSDISALKASLNEAQKALREAIDKVQSNLDTVSSDLKKVIEDLKSTYDVEIKNLRDEIESVNKNAKEENDLLKKELTTLKERIETMDRKNAEDVQAFVTVNTEQGQELSLAKKIATVGLSVAGVSLVFNIVLAILEFKRKKHTSA